MKLLKTLSIAFWAVLIMGSCLPDNNDEQIAPIDPVVNPLEDAILVVNEGQFPNPGSISLVTPDFGFSLHHIFQEVNGEDQDLGGVVQSLFFDEDRSALIVSNGGNFITRVDRYTFERTGKIEEGLDAPRYGVVVGNKAYVTNQGDFSTGDDDYVAVINLDNLSVERQIPVGTYAEHIFKGDDGLLYVEGTAFGEGHEIVIIDPSSDTVVDAIDTVGALNSIVLDHQFVYALTADKLQKWNLQTRELEAEIELPYDETPDKLRYDNDHLYFAVGTKIYDYGVDFKKDAPKLPIVQYTSNSEFGAVYGLEVHEEKIYIADAGDFSSNGFVEVFNLQGISLGKRGVGVGPNGFYFNTGEQTGEGGSNL